MNEAMPGPAAGKKTLAVFAVVERENRAALWIRVGSAWTNRDGSVNLYLDAFPIGTNRLQIREPRFEESNRWGGAANGRGAVPASAEPEAEVQP
jgi:hypothetical protein